MQLERTAEFEWDIPRAGAMRVPGRVFASTELVGSIREDPCLEQVANVACLPGIVGASLGMPDIHWGYGFPIGGVAAFDPKEGGVISPGGVGFDINCGVRLLALTGLRTKKAREHRGELAKALLQAIPAGTGKGGAIHLKAHELDQVGRGGARWAVERDYGTPQDLEHVEERGCAAWADPRHVSADARIRGAPQLGTLGSGNHFLEVQEVEEVYDETAADALGLPLGGLSILIHTGSRGFGHQVCDDFLERMIRASQTHGIELPDRQLCSAPFDSDEGQAYFGAMGAAMNFAFANRQVITHRVREVLAERFGEGVEAALVYDVCHNIAKLERHVVDGVERELVVHRKGATRAFGPGNPALPEAHRELGQPVLVPGDMGRYSYVLLGTREAERRTFGSCCHGAGRVLSRHKARERARGRNIGKELAAQGISLQAAGRATVEEEISEAYKDVSQVVDVVVKSGLAKPVARLKPFVVVKG
jgi:tRNA-splicing ligase RtcB